MPPSPDTRARIRAINRAINDEDRRLRAAMPWLARQDAIGLGIFVGAWSWILAIAAAWIGDALPAWATVPLIALGLSLLHELEHDLIHDLYFSKRPGVQHGMFAGIWLAKMSMDPWRRRQIHLRHHRVSGQPADIEERLIGLGLPLGPRRILLTLIPAFAALQLPDIQRALRDEAAARSTEGRSEPPLPIWRRVVGAISAGFAVLPLVVLPAALAGWEPAVHLAVLYVLPNTIRHASIAFISSSSHYYGDVPENDVSAQNQILDWWGFLPLQIFCFNFGATHVIHHYVVRQPFYLRQMVAPGVRDALLQHGVRRNDLGTFQRANRRGGAP